MRQMKSEASTIFSLLHDEQWLIKLAYLAEIFGKANEITTLLQGKSTSIFMVRDKLSAFKRKLIFWISCVEKDNIECFPLLYNFIHENALESGTRFANHSVDHLPISDQEELIDISCNSRLKSCFAEQSLGDFWANLKDIYHISESAIKYLLPFCTTYLCESGFSAMTNLKTKHRHRLQLEDDLRLKLTEGQPDFQELCKEKRAHLSH
ncbi:hypothetical protein RI129_007730 [Pyrocoelia pectoralis]|uniref:HAT C-terminal dimerisation domain-containing protein n=1 Tax=Pyrocoelia pectoralis TaxID=417401 RepID=A0AAN7V8I2_9COLE